MKKNSLSTSRKIYIGIMKALMWLSVFFTCALVLFLIIYVLFKGFPHITWKFKDHERGTDVCSTQISELI